MGKYNNSSSLNYEIRMMNNSTHIITGEQYNRLMATSPSGLLGIVTEKGHITINMSSICEIVPETNDGDLTSMISPSMRKFMEELKNKEKT